MENALFQVLLLKNFTLKVCEMPMAGTTGPLPYVSATTIDRTYDFLLDISFPHKERYQKEGKLVDDGPDGTWCILPEGGHWMAQQNFSRMEPKDPRAGFLGLAEVTGVEAYKRGFGILNFLPAFEKMEELMPYVFRMHDMVDQKSLSTGFLFNAYKLFFRKARER